MDKYLEASVEIEQRSLISKNRKATERSKKSSFKKIDCVIIGLILIGAVLRLLQYLANTSLWLDEIFLSSNILNRSISQLLANRTLDFGQVAPKGFLVVEKLLSNQFGADELVLRLFPLLCSLAALIAFAFAVRNLLPGLPAAIALALFATARPLVVFGSEVKQYSSDVAIAALLLWVASELTKGAVSFRRSVIAGTIGAVCVWISQPAVLMVGALGLSLLLIAWHQRSASYSRSLVALTPVLAMWGVSAMGAVVISLVTMGAHTRAYMHQYWAEGFMPHPTRRVFELRWPWNELRAFFGNGSRASFGYPFTRLYLLLLCFGFLALWRRLGVRATLISMPVLVALSAAVAGQYPFCDRLVLFLVPSFLIAIAASIYGLYEWLTPRSKYVAAALCVLIVGVGTYPVAAIPPPYHNEDVKPVLKYMRNNWRPGDILYVFNGATIAFTFYSLDYDFRTNEYVLGRCHRGDNIRYRQELDRFRGRPRVWILLAHAIPYLRERDDIVTYLDAIGLRRHNFVVQSRINGELPAEVMLYDLSDSNRLRAANAQSVPLIGPSSVDARTDCQDMPLLSVPPRR